MTIDTETFEHKGHTFTVKVMHDEDARPPWEQRDGFGIVSDWVRREAEDGERVIASDRGFYRYYDMNASREKAIAEQWGLPHDEASGKTPDQIIDAAIEKDFAYLHGWCSNDWSYVGLVVEAYGHDESLWGLESNQPDYLKNVRIELADELLRILPGELDSDIERLQRIRLTLKEAE